MFLTNRVTSHVADTTARKRKLVSQTGSRYIFSYTHVTQRCNSARPACQQCLRANISECVYGQGAELSSIQMLEDRIGMLQDRITFLESNIAGPVLLRDPYAQTEGQSAGQVGPIVTERRALTPAIAQALYVSPLASCALY